MSPPIREGVHLAAAYQTDHPWQLREAIEWYKHTVLWLTEIGPLSPLEVSHLNKSWVAICQAIAEQQGINAGSLSFFLHEIGMAEINLVETAQAEAEAAGL